MKNDFAAIKNWGLKLLFSAGTEKKTSNNKKRKPYEQSVIWNPTKETEGKVHLINEIRKQFAKYRKDKKKLIQVDKADLIQVLTKQLPPESSPEKVYLAIDAYHKRAPLVSKIKTQFTNYRKNNKNLIHVNKDHLIQVLIKQLPLKSSSKKVYLAIDAYHKAKAAQELRQLIQQRLAKYRISNESFCKLPINEKELIATIAPLIHLKTLEKEAVIDHLILLYHKAKKRLIAYRSDVKNPYPEYINETDLIQELISKIAKTNDPKPISDLIKKYCEQKKQLAKIRIKGLLVKYEKTKTDKHRELKIDEKDLISTILPKINESTTDEQITRLIHRYYRSRKKIIKALEEKLESFVSEKNKNSFPVVNTDSQKKALHAKLLPKVTGTTVLNDLDYIIEETYKRWSYESGELKDLPWFNPEKTTPSSAVHSEPRRETICCLGRTHLFRGRRESGKAKAKARRRTTP